MYVARYSFNPEYDAIRNWSAWIGIEGSSPEDVALQIADAVAHPPALVDWGTGECFAWEDAPEGLKITYVLENEDIRFHEGAKRWMHVHHDGLSAWRLDAETLAEAVEEARDLEARGKIEWSGFGVCTGGEVKYVASVNSTLHIFECDYVTSE